MAQGVVTGIRGLCNGLGPALYGVAFFFFDVNLNEPSEGGVTLAPAIAANVTMTTQPHTSKHSIATVSSPAASKLKQMFLDIRCMLTRFYVCVCVCM